VVLGRRTCILMYAIRGPIFEPSSSNKTCCALTAPRANARLQPAHLRVSRRAPALHSCVFSAAPGTCTTAYSSRPAGRLHRCVFSRPAGRLHASEPTPRGSVHHAETSSTARSEPNYTWLTTDTPLGEDRSQSKTRVPRLSPPAGRHCKDVSEEASKSSV